MNYASVRTSKFVIKEGDTNKTFDVELNDEFKNPIDLSGSSIRVLIANKKNIVLNKLAKITNAPEGLFSFTFIDSDVTGNGVLDIEFSVTYPNGKKEIFPEDGYLKLQIIPSLNSRPNNVVAANQYQILSNEFEDLSFTVDTFDGRIAASETKVNSYGSRVSLLEEKSDSTAASLAQIAYVIHLNKWGIYNDGTHETETTQGIQNAVDWAVSNGYGKVILPSGTYLIATESNYDSSIGGGIDLPSNIIFEMNYNTILKMKKNSNSPFYTFFRIRDKENIVITGGTILGDRDDHNYAVNPTYPVYTTHEFGHGVRIRSGWNVRIVNVNMKNVTGDCIIVQSSKHATNPEYNPSRRIFIENCVFDGARRNGIAITNASGVYIINNEIKDIGKVLGTLPKYGIDIEGYGEGQIDFEVAEKIIISGNKITGCVNCSIGTFTGYKTVITNNFVDSLISYGYGRDVIISDNVVQASSITVGTVGIMGAGITKNSEGAIAEDNTANNLIIGNVIKHFDKGMSIRGQHNLVTNNTIFKCNEGIGLYDVQYSTVAENKITEVNKGIYCSAGSPRPIKHVHIKNNVISETTGYAINLFDISDVNVIGNIIAMCFLGVSIKNAVKTIVKQNRIETRNVISENGSYMLNISNTITELIIEDNIFVNCVSYPINVVNSVTGDISIIRNYFQRIYVNSAIYASGTVNAKLFICNNIFEADYLRGTSFKPIVITGATNCNVLNNLIYCLDRSKSLGTATIDTSGATNTLIVGNTIVKGQISSNATDIVQNNTLIA